jgi:hypothetical protein
VSEAMPRSACAQDSEGVVETGWVTVFRKFISYSNVLQAKGNLDNLHQPQLRIKNCTYLQCCGRIKEVFA